MVFSLSCFIFAKSRNQVSQLGHLHASAGLSQFHRFAGIFPPRETALLTAAIYD
jgi:hypothetical protein